LIALAQGAFHPAAFSGLVLGKATLREMQAKFGPPSDRLVDAQGTTWAYYKDIGEVAGRVEVIADTKTAVIETITITASTATLDEVKRVLGAGFRDASFSFDGCLAKGGAGPIFEDKNGSLRYVVYDRLGIALLIAGSTVHIEYLSQPLGPKTSQCLGKAKNKKK
jgi:hypothetical protein